MFQLGLQHLLGQMVRNNLFPLGEATIMIFTYSATILHVLYIICVFICNRQLAHIDYSIERQTGICNVRRDLTAC